MKRVLLLACCVVALPPEGGSHSAAAHSAAAHSAAAHVAGAYSAAAHVAGAYSAAAHVAGAYSAAAHSAAAYSAAAYSAAAYSAAAHSAAAYSAAAHSAAAHSAAAHVAGAYSAAAYSADAHGAAAHSAAAHSAAAHSAAAHSAAAHSAAAYSAAAHVAGALFVESATATGLAFTHVNGATGHYYMPEVMGAGAALFDYDGDGDLDVFFVQGGALDGASQSEAPTSRLFRNDLSVTGSRRTLRFTDVTDRAGVGLRAYGMGAAVGDYDNDGDVDLFVTTFGPETLFRNNGDGTFTDVTAQAGVSDSFWSTSAAFADYDRDGDLDLYVANYLDFTVAGNKVCHDAVGARDYCSPRAYRPVPDRLYRNDGNGRFSDATEPAGISKADGAGLGVVAGDYNGDGWIDFYVANDANPNQLWINQRNGKFEDEGLLSGAAVNAAGNPEGSMGIASGDFDLDGDEDLFVTNIIGETFVLYANDGKGNFEDVRARVGLAAPTAAYTGFGTDWFDYDNDGLQDLFVANGAVNILEAQRGQPRPFRMKNQLFRNTGGRFVETTVEAGPAFAAPNIGRGAAFGDIDNDGDVDVLVTTNGGPSALLINEAAAGRHWIEMRPEQESGNRLATGAWVGVERAGAPTLWRRVKTDGSYLSASDSRIHVGLGSATAIGGVTVRWPDGASERFTVVGVDRAVTLKRGAGKTP